MDNHNLPLNFQLNNKYIIKKVLSQGGFGITYLAEDSLLDIDVCIKELFISGSSTRGTNMTVLIQGLGDFSFADFKQRFIQEAKQLARFNHPNIVRAIEFFEANNTAYVVMEYVKGPTLKEKVMKHGPLSAAASQKIIESVLDAVEVVHKAGTLHRDIKPDNMIITDEGRVVLLDFGSARAYSDEKTIAQTAFVTPGYAPLEQYNPNARKGTFTDIYSIGATFYFMLTGEKPLNVTERYTERLKAPHEINPSVSMQVSSAVMLAMEMKAEDRFQDVADFRLGLKQLSNLKKTKDDSKTIVYDNPKPIVSNPQQAKKTNFVLPLLIIAAIVGIGIYYFNQGPVSTQTVEETIEEPKPTNTQSEKKTRKWSSYNYYGNNSTEYIDEIYISDNGEREFYYYNSNNNRRINMPVSERAVNGSANIYVVQLGQNYFKLIINGNSFTCIDMRGGAPLQYYQPNN